MWSEKLKGKLNLQENVFNIFHVFLFIFFLTDDAILSASPAVCALQLATAPSNSAVNAGTTAAATAVERRPPRAVL